MPRNLWAQDHSELIRLLPRPVFEQGQGTGRLSCPFAFPFNISMEIEKYSLYMCLMTVVFMYSVHNLMAPNMTAIANLFHFNHFERDEYIGGELALFFYLPGIFSSLISGILCGFVKRRTMLAVLAAMTSLSCLATAWVQSFQQLAWSRAFTGCGIGGALPIFYSMIGDWFPAARRATGSAMVAASMGGGVFLGQCIAALFGANDWRFPFVLVAVPCFMFAGLIELTTEEPARGGQEDSIEALYQHTGVHYKPTLTMRHIYVAFANRTNLLIIFQAFPGNVPWGVIMVYLHDFLMQDLGLSSSQGLLAITVLAASAFVGVVFGGWIAEKIYARGSQQLIVFCAVCNAVRALPWIFLFGWARMFGSLNAASTSCYISFFTLLTIAGCLATVASAGTGAMLLNVNLPEIRGSIAALYSVLDDVSKGLGVLFISALIPYCGGRAVAYQYSLLLWLICGVALLLALKTYEEDERKMKEYLEEVALECMVRISKRNAQQAIKRCAKAAGEVHLKDRNSLRGETSRLKWDNKVGKMGKV